MLPLLGPSTPWSVSARDSSAQLDTLHVIRLVPASLGHGAWLDTIIVL